MYYLCALENVPITWDEVMNVLKFILKDGLWLAGFVLYAAVLFSEWVTGKPTVFTSAAGLIMLALTMLGVGRVRYLDSAKIAELELELEGV